MLAALITAWYLSSSQGMPKRMLLRTVSLKMKAVWGTYATYHEQAQLKGC